MQKTIQFLMMACAMLMVACAPEVVEPVEKDHIAVSEMEVTATADASEINIAVSASSDEWTVESDSEWCQAEKADKTLTLSLEENTSSERIATVTLTCGEATANLTIIQADGTVVIEDAISVVNIELTMPAKASTLFLPVSATGEWYPESDSKWCLVEETDNGVSISLQTNRGDVRTATVTLYCGTASAVVKLTQQKGASIDVAPAELTFSAKGGELQLGVTTENIDDWSASTTDKWLTVSTQGGIITVTAAANTKDEVREGVVTINYLDPTTGEPGVIEVGVSQGTAIQVSTEVIDLEANQTEATVTVSAIDAWTAEASHTGATWIQGIAPKWLTISYPEGDELEKEVKITVTPGYTNRAASVLITCGKNTKEVVINQKAMPAPQQGRTVRVMTWNQNVKGNEATAKVITDNNIDFVALQEVDVNTGRSGGKDQMAELKRLTGYEGAYFCKTINFDGGEYGIGILSKKEAIKTYKLDIPGSESRKLFIAEYDDFVFASTHFSYSGESQMRIDHLASAKIAVEEFKKYTDKPVVLGGDFNTETDIDKRQTHGTLMEIMDLIIDPSIMTWPGSIPAGEMYLLDFLFIKSHVPYAWTNGAWVNNTNSDHCPVWAEVVLFE
ncbi:MAG: hypothetical protein E7128_00735 [Rikenellaceae bacterium]|nr:hypothetical protein [Rikenellaceae bacterium]